MNEPTESAAHPGMGALLYDGGVAFRVWAPHAEAVAVTGSFNDWAEDAHPLTHEANGYWYTEVEGAAAGDEYKYVLRHGDQTLHRIDPYARAVTNSVGNTVIYDTAYDWGDDAFMMPPWNEVVLYEMHIGTFHRAHDDVPGGFLDARSQFGHLQSLGVNVLQLMPAAEFAGDLSWGYNPAHIFAIESAYGGPDAFKAFVKAAHQAGFAVVLDVVYNHFGPSDLDLWRFDGWHEHDGGGIYFYNDWRARTPWGDTRPDYGRPEVRQFIRDNAVMWLDEYHVDGLRFDMTQYVRTVDGGADTALPEGWSLKQWLNEEIMARAPNALTIAEDMQDDAAITQPVSAGGAGFSAQWDAFFVHTVRKAITLADDAHRPMTAVASALVGRLNDDAFERVVFTESHDEVSNGKARIPHEINPDNPDDWFAQKRATLGAGLVFTAPGIPMLFQGQEFLQGAWFDDAVPLDWDRRDAFHGITRLFRDLIVLRRNLEGHSRGLTGQGIDVFHINDVDKLIAFRRFEDGGPGDEVVIIANFANRTHDAYRLGFPSEGPWHLRLNSDWEGYSDAFASTPSADLAALPDARDGLPAAADVCIGPYTLLVYSQAPG